MDKNKIAVDLFDQFADLYQTKFMDVSLYHDTFDLFCHHLPQKHAEILELACGPGNITHYLLQQRPDFQILATDLAPKMLELAAQNNPTAQFALLDARKITSLAKQFDGLMCGFCLPYLSKTEAIQLIADAAKILKPKGLIYLSTMEDAYEKSDWKTGSTGTQIFQHFHEAEYLTAALEANGFRVLDVARKRTAASDGAEVVDLVILGELMG